jgi:hypothetical protein
MRYAFSVLLSLALSGITLLSISAACASSLPAYAAFAMSDAPVLTQHGLTILPARVRGAAPRVDVTLPSFDATPPAHILDRALAGIATRYGRATAYDVASAFEYPGFQK